MGIRSRLWRSKTDSSPSTLRHDLSTIPYEYGRSQSFSRYGIPLAPLIDITHFGVTIPLTA